MIRHAVASAVLFFCLLDAANGQCPLRDLIVPNGMAIFGTTNTTQQASLSMTVVPSGGSAYVICKKGYAITGGSDSYVSNTCSGTTWSGRLSCDKNKLKYGMSIRDAKQICSAKFSKTINTRCGWLDVATNALTNGPCDAATDNRCPFRRDKIKASKNYNFCACLVPEMSQQEAAELSQAAVDNLNAAVLRAIASMG